MKASPKILRRPAYGDYGAGGSTSRAAGARRASLSMATTGAVGGGGKYSRFAAANAGDKPTNLMDAVLGNDGDGT
eukprot:SAG11_NODE_18863_length_479_cov_1.886842_1_plen_75_part_00